MKKLYEEFFAIPTDGKIPEKVMLTRAVLTVAVILVCLSAMGITAYAYFSHSLISGQNTIKAAGFGVDITIQNIDPTQDPVTVEIPPRRPNLPYFLPAPIKLPLKEPALLLPAIARSPLPLILRYITPSSSAPVPTEKPPLPLR